MDSIKIIQQSYIIMSEIVHNLVFFFRLALFLFNSSPYYNNSFTLWDHTQKLYVFSDFNFMLRFRDETKSLFTAKCWGLRSKIMLLCDPILKWEKQAQLSWRWALNRFLFYTKIGLKLFICHVLSYFVQFHESF